MPTRNIRTWREPAMQKLTCKFCSNPHTSDNPISMHSVSVAKNGYAHSRCLQLQYGARNLTR